METRELKNSVKTASGYLAEHGIDVPHTRLLEALSRALGERNWSTLKARLDTPYVHPESGRTADELWLETGKLRSQLADIKADSNAKVPEYDATQGPMSEAQFVHYRGKRCPFCGGTHLESDGVEADGEDSWDHTKCLDCGSTWNTAYIVSGYYNATAGERVTKTRGPSGLSPEHQALVGQLRDWHGLVITARDDDRAGWEGLVFRAKEALPLLLREMEDLAATTSIDEALKTIESCAEAAAELLKLHHVSTVYASWGCDAEQATERALSMAPRLNAVPLGRLSCPFGDDDVLVFTYLDGASLRYKGLAYSAPAAWKALTQWTRERDAFSVERLVQLFNEDESDCVEALMAANILPLFTKEYANAGRAYCEVVDELRRQGRQAVQAYRQDVVQELVEHVQHLAKKYDFSVGRFNACLDLAYESSELLKLEATTAEHVEAARRLS